MLSSSNSLMSNIVIVSLYINLFKDSREISPLIKHKVYLSLYCSIEIFLLLELLELYFFKCLLEENFQFSSFFDG